VERKSLWIAGGHGITAARRLTPNQQGLDVSLLLAS
jgi:head-tail adaptor